MKCFQLSIVQTVCVICLGILLSAMPAITWSDPDKTEMIETVLQGYQALLDEAHILEARVTVDLMAFQKSMVREAHRPLFESLYSLPIEDPIYNTAPLYYQSTSLLGWDTILNGVKMTVAQQIKSSDTYLSPVDFRTMNTLNYDRKLSISHQEFASSRFTVESLNTENPAPIWPIIFPKEITDWSYLPNCWYPPRNMLYLPDSAAEIRHRGTDHEAHVLQYKPVGMSESFLIFLQYLSGDPELSVDDLVCIANFDFETHALILFGIAIQEGRNRHHLINLSHTHTGTMLGEVPIPNSSNFSMSAFVPIEDKDEWRMHYMSRFQVNQVELLN